MKKFYLIVFCFLCIIPNTFSQKTLSDYSYVIVSKQFNFQNEKDQYQLNSLTKFLFNKYGFHAYFNSEVPNNVKRCDGLWADAEGIPGFIYTKLEVVLRDCNGTEVFRSIEGKSKQKDFKKAYYESMREAFVSIQKLEVTQKEINDYEEEVISDDIISKKNNKTAKTATSVVVVKKTSDAKSIDTDLVESEKINEDNLPSAKFSSYSYVGKTFLLRKTSSGYSLYEESITADDGLLLIGKIVLSPSNIIFFDANNNEQDAHFDNSKNLIIVSREDRIVYKLEN